jgi:hypothetical protein
LEKLGKSGMDAQAQEAVAKHETAFLKKCLNMKATYKKSRVRMTKGNMEYAKLFTQEDVNVALEEYEAKQRKLAELAAKKEGKGKGGKRGKKNGKKATGGVVALPTTPVASGSRSETQVSDSEGQLII